MKELLLSAARYNTWANKNIVDTMCSLDDALLDKEIASSFPSLRKTAYHVWSAENVWLQRLQQVLNLDWIAGTFAGSFTDACAHWQQVSGALVALVSTQNDDATLLRPITYHDLRGNLHNTPMHHILHHIFNHGTYHRGQLVTMLRQSGVKDIPATDYIAFVRMQ